MEPRSRPDSTRSATLGLPLALVLLLNAALARSTSDQVTQVVTDLAWWQNIRKSACRLLQPANSLVSSGDPTFSLLVGMVQLAAFCSFASVLWIRSKRSRKAKAIDAQYATPGKIPKDSP